MNKKILQIGLVSLAVMLATLPVFAATLSLSPANVSVKQGQTFNAVVTLDPQGVKNYTAKVELKYPANLLEVRSFSFGDKWMALSQAGYDLVDNANGVLVKTAGYPGGLTSPATFGTVTFVAKTSGNGTISVGNNTQVFDASNSNVLNGSSQVSVMVGPASVIAAVPNKQVAMKTAPAVSPLPTVPSSLANISGTVAKQGSTVAFATIGNVLSLGTGKSWLAILVVVVVVLAVYFSVRKRKTREK